MPIPIYTQLLPKGYSFDMHFVKGGIFDMGNEEPDASEREKPVHKVQLDDFYIGKFPVTQALWKAVMGEENNPSFFEGNDRPVESISWNDCQQFISALNSLTESTLFPGFSYRMPTEAEWEYAAGGGESSEGYRYAGSDKLEEVGWYWENADRETRDVGLLQPNALGLYDMSGNVLEWCWDRYGSYKKNARETLEKNPRGPVRGVNRVIRGGSWFNVAVFCRVSGRYDWDPEVRNFYLGFRLVLSPQSVGS